MSAKELMLLPKHKYDLLTKTQTQETVSVATQTCDEEQAEVKSNDNKKEDFVRNSLTSEINETASTVQAVRSPSWNNIPGIRAQKVERISKKSIKWIPY